MSSQISHTDKIRQQLRQQRRALSSEQQDAASEDLAGNIQRLHVFQTSRRVACYLPNDGEIDPGLIIERILGQRKKCYLPVLSRINGNKLLFAPVTYKSEMGINRFGIPEPIVRLRDLVSARELDLVLLPLVAFDQAGNRIGMGGGYYDRSLQFMRYRHRWYKPYIVGIAHEIQKLDHIDSNPWDIPMHAIVTEQNIYVAGKSA